MILFAAPKIKADLQDGQIAGAGIDLGAAAVNIGIGFGIGAVVGGLGIVGLPAACLTIAGGLLLGAGVDRIKNYAKKRCYGE